MLGHFGMIPLVNHDSSEGDQWGRWNLPSLYVANLPPSISSVSGVLAATLIGSKRYEQFLGDVRKK